MRTLKSVGGVEFAVRRLVGKLLVGALLLGALLSVATASPAMAAGGAGTGAGSAAPALPLPIPGMTPPPEGKPSRSEDAKALEQIHPTANRSARAFSDISRSFAEIFHWGIVLRLLLGLSLAVAFAAVIAWHPRRATKLDPLSDLEERKTLILLGMVGAVVAALVTARADQAANPMAGYLAFVIFGIGALMRFRTALDNPKLTGKAILVVVIGIACGLTEWSLAVWMTLAAFLLIWFLDSHLACRVRISLAGKKDANLDETANTARRVLMENRCRVKSASIDSEKRRIVVLAHMPARLDPTLLEAALHTAVAAHGEGSVVQVQVA